MLAAKWNSGGTSMTIILSHLPYISLLQTSSGDSHATKTHIDGSARYSIMRKKIKRSATLHGNYSWQKTPDPKSAVGDRSETALGKACLKQKGG